MGHPRPWRSTSFAQASHKRWWQHVTNAVEPRGIHCSRSCRCLVWRRSRRQRLCWRQRQVVRVCGPITELAAVGAHAVTHCSQKLHVGVTVVICILYAHLYSVVVDAVAALLEVMLGFPYFVGPAFSIPVFSTPVIWSRVFQSRVFTARVLLCHAKNVMWEEFYVRLRL